MRCPPSVKRQVICSKASALPSIRPANARMMPWIKPKTKERAEQSLKRAADVTTRYVSEQPVRSILVAAAVGAAVALLVANNRQRNHNRY